MPSRLQTMATSDPPTPGKRKTTQRTSPDGTTSKHRTPNTPPSIGCVFNPQLHHNGQVNLSFTNTPTQTTHHHAHNTPASPSVSRLTSNPIRSPPAPVAPPLPDNPPDISDAIMTDATSLPAANAPAPPPPPTPAPLPTTPRPSNHPSTPAHSATTAQAADDSSEATERGSHRLSLRLAVCAVIEEGQNPNKEIFLQHLAKELNNIIDVCVKFNSDIKAIPWTQRTATTDKAVDAFKPCPIHLKAFLHNYKPRNTHIGNHYFRLHLSVPHALDKDDFAEHLDAWYTAWPRFARIAPSPAMNPVTQGWCMRSHRLQIKTNDLIHRLRHLSGCRSIGADWKRVQDGSKWVKGKKSTNPFAVHIECDEAESHAVLAFCKNAFGSTNFQLAPHGVSWGFIPDVGTREMKGSRTALYQLSKCMALQAIHIDHIETTVVDDILDFEDEVKPGLTLRDWLMRLTITTLDKRKGDRVFLSVDRTGESDNSYTLCYHKAVSEEAASIARNLPLVLRDELQLDITQYCVFGVDRALADWSWDSDTRAASNPLVASLESMVSACGPLLEVEAPEDASDTATLDTVGQMNYDRLNGKESDTVLGDATNVPLRPHLGAPPVLHTDAGTVASGLTEGTTESKRQQAREEAIAQVEAELLPTMEAAHLALAFQESENVKNMANMKKMFGRCAELLEAAGRGQYIEELSTLLNNSETDPDLLRLREEALKKWNLVALHPPSEEAVIHALRAPPPDSAYKRAGPIATAQTYTPTDTATLKAMHESIKASLQSPDPNPPTPTVPLPPPSPRSGTAAAPVEIDVDLTSPSGTALDPVDVDMTDDTANPHPPAMSAGVTHP